jgi:hypothetical protein
MFNPRFHHGIPIWSFSFVLIQYLSLGLCDHVIFQIQPDFQESLKTQKWGVQKMPNLLGKKGCEDFICNLKALPVLHSNILGQLDSRPNFHYMASLGVYKWTSFYFAPAHIYSLGDPLSQWKPIGRNEGCKR